MHPTNSFPCFKSLYIKTSKSKKPNHVLAVALCVTHHYDIICHLIINKQIRTNLQTSQLIHQSMK